MSESPIEYFSCMQLFDPSDESPHTTNLKEHENDFDGPLSLALNPSVKWEPGQTLRIRLIDPTAEQAELVELHARTWLQFANLKFNFFTEEKDAEIRVTFTEGGSYSWVGKWIGEDADNQKAHTMNLGWLVNTQPKAIWKRTILHEFGHAIGCVHEHQSFPGNLKLNIPKIIIEYKGRWSAKEVRHNWGQRDRRLLETAPNYDPLSIMHYDIPARWILNNSTGRGIERSGVLSATDKLFIAKMYPRIGHNTGNWASSDLLPPGRNNQNRVPIEPALSEAPVITAGLNALEARWTSANPNIRFRVKANGIRADRFDLNLDSWSNSNVISAATTYFVSSPGDKDFQVGTFNTMDVRDWKPPVKENTDADTGNFEKWQLASKRVEFAHQFAKEPNVVVWINWIYSDSKEDTKVMTYTSGIDTKGFTIHIDTWDTSRLYSGGASWIAYRSDQTSVHSREIDARLRGNRSNELPENNTGSVNFPAGTFDKNPKVLMGISLIDFEKDHDVAFKASASEPTIGSMKWHLDLTGSTVCRNATLSFLALQ